MSVTLAANDRTTGLLLTKPFRAALERAATGEETVTLGLLDLDHFKELNDEHGPAAGDELLASLGQRIQALAERAGGFGGRLGGDEFAIVLPGVSLEAGFLQFERFRAQLEAEADALTPSVPSYRASLSIGVANYPRDVKEISELVNRADQALWAAKEAGRNQVALPSSEEMILKTCYYTTAQVGRLKKLAEARKAKEATLLREALDDLLRKYDVKPSGG